MSLDWMAWTLPTAFFFIAIAFMLAGMTMWEIVMPTRERRGWLPIATTRGDRFFIGLLGSAYLHLTWLAATETALWPATVLSVVFLVAMLRWG